MKKILSYWLFVFCSMYAYSDQISELNSQLQVDGQGSALISGFTFQNKEVVYEKINGLGFFEGDIVLGTEADLQSFESIEFGTRSIIISSTRYRWVNNLVPFQFDSGVSTQTKTMVYDAIEHWESNTPIRFVERSSANSSGYSDYVNVISDDYACWSYVGRRGGSQDLNVVPACGFGSIVHEFGHAIGLWHEQSREDRDNFVQINWENITSGKEHNFNQHISDGDDIGDYDYDSIMHYGAYSFSNNGSPTITPLQSATIGQRSGLSVLDINSIYLNYPEFLPEAIIAKSNYSVFLGNNLTLNGLQSFDPNGDDLDYYWDLGDGTINDRGSIISHLYDERGHYQITLTVEDSERNQDTDVADVNVYGVEVLIPILATLLN